ncbi:hypothetical protein [Aeromicrobium sp. NPDC092404]|uniref:hypothetical protein n=1 Tax=Aeromicrobium sp. NPDC092404 TaxID=3154976 RepID=UPI003443572D
MTSSHDWDSGSTGPSQGQPSATGTGSFDSPGSSASGGDAKERAQQAAGTAKEQGAHVADTAKSEAQQVVGEAKEKAADLLGDARSQIDQQSKSQLQALASKLEELSSEVDSMVEGSSVQGTVTELARQLSDKTRTLSNRLSDREPKDVLEDVRGFARQKPGTFLLGALAAGVVAGRLTRGAKEAHSSGSSTGSASASAPTSPGGAAGAAGVSAPPTPAPTAGDLSSGSAVGGLGGDPAVPAGQNAGGRP